MTIYVPPSLSSADQLLTLSDAFAKILDPKERAKIADDIKAHHALNDSEAKKHADAIALIKKHSDTLEETKKISENNKKDAESLDEKRRQFNAYVESEQKKLSIDKQAVKEAFEAASKLHAHAEEMKAQAEAKETALVIAKAEHQKAVNELEEKSEAQKIEKQKIEEFRTSVMELDRQTNAKIDKLKQFNF